MVYGREIIQGGAVSPNTTGKYYDAEYPIAFPSWKHVVIPVDIITGDTVTSAPATPGIIWASAASTNSTARFVSDTSFNNAGIGRFGYLAFGY